MSTLRTNILRNRSIFASLNEQIDSNGHKYVDLDLPSGNLWATCNVGATSPEQYGDYFAWGETLTKSSFSWSNYSLCEGSQKTMTKYCTDSSYGTVDNKTVLEPEDDVAKVKWGGMWLMPTWVDWLELNDHCIWTWTNLNGINGYNVTSKTDTSKFIFLPAAGIFSNSSVSASGSYGYYWSNSLNIYYPYLTFYLNLNSSSIHPANYNSRYFGLSVRPIILPQTEEIGEEGGTNEAFRFESNISITTLTVVATGNMSLQESYKDETPLLNGRIRLEYNIGYTGWHLVKLNEPIQFGANLGNIALRGYSEDNIGTALNNTNYLNFEMTGSTGSVLGFGNIKNLVNYKDWDLADNKTARFCYLFSNNDCIYLSPDLTLVNLASRCYMGMFSHCAGLKIPSFLPALTMATECYARMYMYCWNLASAGTLRGVILAPYCYEYMYWHTSITKIKLPALRSSLGCYKDMITGSPVKEITLLLMDGIQNSIAGNSEDSLLSSANASTGIIKINKNRIYDKNELYTKKFILSGWAIEEIIEPFHFVNTGTEEHPFEITYLNLNPSILLLYSFGSDDDDYNDLFWMTLSNLITICKYGTNIYIRSAVANNPYGTCINPSGLSYDGLQFVINSDNEYACCGDIRWLLSNTNPASVSGSRACYCNLFRNCSNLIIGPELPSLQVGNYAYSMMFFGCNHLKETPWLPATVLGDMCYQYMFDICLELLYTVPELPATILKSNCYFAMYASCMNLIAAPKLPAITLTEGCYARMFEYCENIMQIELPATTVVNSCYWGMLRRCSNLIYIKMMATNFIDSAFRAFSEGIINGAGTFVKSSSATWPNNLTATNWFDDGTVPIIPEGWRVLSEVSVQKVQITPLVTLLSYNSSTRLYRFRVSFTTPSNLYSIVNSANNSDIEVLDLSIMTNTYNLYAGDLEVDDIYYHLESYLVAKDSNLKIVSNFTDCIEYWELGTLDGRDVLLIGINNGFSPNTTYTIEILATKPKHLDNYPSNLIDSWYCHYINATVAV